MRKARWLWIALLTTLGASAAEFKDLEERLREVVPDAARPLAERKEIVGEMGSLGTPEAVDSLLWAVATVDQVLEKDYEERARLDVEYAPFRTEKDWQKFKDPMKKREELDEKIRVVDARILDHETVLETLLRELRTQSTQEALAEIASSSSLRADNWRARAFAGAVAAGAKGVEADAAMKLLRDSDPRVRLFVAEGYGERKDPATIPDLGGFLLKEDSWQVRAALVATLGDIGSIKAVRFLIERMGKESGRLLEDINDVLKRLTGQNFQPDPTAWKNWYDENKATIEGGEDVRGPRAGRVRPREGAEFYGLELLSQRIVYIIDTSGSMEDPMGTPQVVTGDDEDSGFTGPKIELAKRELKRSIRALDKSAWFNIVAFNFEVKTWQPKMTAATQGNKNESYVWVRSLKAEASTYLYGALKVAFDLAGMGALDERYEPSVDTIVLLSDGAPTDNTMAATRMDPEIILKAVRAWNKLAKIRIHVIAIDEAKSIRFLRDLAKENNGTYIAK